MIVTLFILGFWILTVGTVLSSADTGGTITIDGLYTVHTFLTNDTYVSTSAKNISFLLVAGGGAGGLGASWNSGGGGAGGLIYNASSQVTATSYPIVIGRGATTFMKNGENSTFNGFKAIGGGNGSTGALTSVASNGGSGGGTGQQNTNFGSGTAGQGNNGATYNGVSGYGSNGGGGHNTTGFQSGTNDFAKGGRGGLGTNFSISGTTKCYAGGGGGGTHEANTTSTRSLGGCDNSGQGAVEGAGLQGTNATNGFGGGGGGNGRIAFAGTNNGVGGSGVLIIRYLTPSSQTIYNVTFTTYSVYNSVLISNFSLKIDNNTYNTSTGSIIVELNISSNKTLNYTAFGFYSKDFASVNLSSIVHNTSLQQYDINMTEPTLSYDALLVGYNITIQNNTNYSGFVYNITYRIENVDDGITYNQSSNIYQLKPTDFQNIMRFRTYACTIYQCNLSNYGQIDNNTINQYFTLTAYGYLNNVLGGTTQWVFRNTTGGVLSTSGNPLLILATYFINNTNKQRNHNIEIGDPNFLYVNYTGINTFYENVSSYNFTLTPNRLSITFMKNGSLYATTGFVSDTQPSTRGFNGTYILLIQQNLSLGEVDVIFNDINNWTQYYEYINDYTTYINETVEIIPVNNLWYGYIKVVDLSNAPIENAVIRIEYTIPSILNNKTGVLLGQRLTRSDGFTFIVADKNSQMLVSVAKDGFAPFEALVSFGDEQYTRESPFVVYLQQSSTGVKDNAWMYIPLSTNNKSKDIKGTIVAKSYSTIGIQTTYRDSQGLGIKDVTNLLHFNGRHTFTLVSGTDFSPLTTDDIQLMVYLDNVLWTNQTIKYVAPSEQNNIFPQNTDLNTKVATIIEFFGLIIMIIIMNLLFKESRAGLHTFMIGSIVLAIINPTYYIWLGVIAGFYYMGRLINLIIGE